MLGSACLRAFGPEAVGCDYVDFDIGDAQATLREIRRLAPRLIVNCAAATDVDRCELDHDYADRANVIGPAHVAEAAATIGARLLHVSTDFVFDGSKGRPYVETDEPRPINHYGLSKLLGEQAVLAAAPDALIVRTSWLYGEGNAHFPAKVLAWADSATEIRVVDDQWGSPTYAEDLACALNALVESGAEGVFHLGGAGCVSRHDWAREIVAVTGSDACVLPASTADFPLPAARPPSSCLDCSKAARLGVELPPWRDGLARYLRSLVHGC